MRLIDKSKSSIDSDSNWLITLSDVLSLLLVFFIMFFVMSRRAGDQKRPAEGGALNIVSRPDLRPVHVNEDKIKAELSSAIKKLQMEDNVSVRSFNNEVVVTMNEKVTFRPGETDILKDLFPMLGHIADIIKRYPSYNVEIDGHTDNVPISTPLYPSNWELSVARATSVLKYFIDSQGIDPSRFSIKGNADQRPLVPNDTPEHRAQNRRVEIRLRKAGA